MVDPPGAVVEEIQGLGGVPRDGLPDPHDQQGQDGPVPREPGDTGAEGPEISPGIPGGGLTGSAPGGPQPDRWTHRRRRP